MSFKEKVEKVFLEMGENGVSKETKEKFLQSMKKDINAALEDNKIKYEAFLDNKLEELDGIIKAKVDKHMEENNKTKNEPV